LGAREHRHRNGPQAMSEHTWGLADDIHVEAWKYHKEVDDLAEYNAVLWFTRELLEDSDNLTEEEIFELETLIDTAITAQTIIKKYLGPNYVQEHIDNLGDTDE